MNRKEEIKEMLGSIQSTLLLLNWEVKQGVISEGEYRDFIIKAKGGYKDGTVIRGVRDWERIEQYIVEIRHDLRVVGDMVA